MYVIEVGWQFSLGNHVLVGGQAHQVKDSSRQVVPVVGVGKAALPAVDVPECRVKATAEREPLPPVVGAVVLGSIFQDVRQTFHHLRGD